MDYLADVQKALNYIEINLDRNMNIRQLAAYSFCSEYHFHRIFRAAVGLPVISYIRKRRLTKAVGLLAKTDARISDIAEQCGFGSHMSFTRVFKKEFGLTPWQYREEKLPVTTYSNVVLSGRVFHDKFYGITLGPMITYMPDFQMVGYTVTGTYEEFRKHPLTAKIWDRLISCIDQINHKKGYFLYGVLYCNPEYTYTYHAGIEVYDASDIPDGMECRSVPAAMCALFTHRFTSKSDNQLETIPFTHQYIFSSWLPNSKYEHANDIFLIERLNREGNHMNMLIPVKPKKDKN